MLGGDAGRNVTVIPELGNRNRFQLDNRGRHERADEPRPYRAGDAASERQCPTLTSHRQRGVLPASRRSGHRRRQGLQRQAEGVGDAPHPTTPAPSPAERVASPPAPPLPASIIRRYPFAPPRKATMSVMAADYAATTMAPSPAEHHHHRIAPAALNGRGRYRGAGSCAGLLEPAGRLRRVLCLPPVEHRWQAPSVEHEYFSTGINRFAGTVAARGLQAPPPSSSACTSQASTSQRSPVTSTNVPLATTGSGQCRASSTAEWTNRKQ